MIQKWALPQKDILKIENYEHTHRVMRETDWRLSLTEHELLLEERFGPTGMALYQRYNGGDRCHG